MSPLHPSHALRARLQCRLTSAARLALLTAVALGSSTVVAQTPTATTLAATSAGAATATLASGTVLTLTASVTAAGNPVTRGQVSFCDASALACTDIHLLATAQITPAGTATLRFVPGIGAHSYKAMFLGTPHATPAYAASTSATTSLTVTGTFPTTTTVTSTGTPGNYSLTATVTGQVNTLQPPSLTGTVALADASANNLPVGSLGLSGAPLTTLSWSFAALAFSTIETPLVADLNGDGKMDAIFSGPGPQQISVMLGVGDGTFTAAPGSPFGVIASSQGTVFPAVTGDFNNDGKTDIALSVVADNGLRSTQILLGNGDGSFTPAAGPAPSGISVFALVADYNRDGNLDMICLDSSTLLLGNGDGTFTAQPLNIQDNKTPGLLSAGDLNGDGNSDLLMVEATGQGLPGSSPYYNGQPVNIYVLLGNGDGTFTGSQIINAGVTGTLSAVAADFDGDGHPDLAIGDGRPGTLTIYKGAGDGTFTQVPGAPMSVADPLSLAVADFNGDGKTDLLVSCFVCYPDLDVLLGNGDGTFTPGPSIFTTTDIAFGPGIADFNGDGVPDILNSGEPTPELHLTHLTQTASATATSIAPLGTGIHQITATYPGNTTYAASTSTPIPLTAQQLKPTVTLTPPSGTYTAQPTPISITVTPPTGDPTPTGTVTLTAGSYTSSPVTLSGGAATIAIPASTFAAGPIVVTVTYTGDANYTTTTGTASLTFITSSYTLSATALSVKAGASTGNSSAITVTPIGGFSGAVALTAALTASPENASFPPTLSFGSSSPVTLTAPAAGAATLTVTTTPAEVCGVPVAFHRSSRLTRGSSTALACLLLLWLPRRRNALKGRRSLQRTLGLLTLFLVSAALTACGGSNGGSPTCNVATAGTTAGAYTITITGTSGATVASTTLNLTVQ